jgi:hypothetical protein
MVSQQGSAPCSEAAFRVRFGVAAGHLRQIAVTTSTEGHPSGCLHQKSLRPNGPLPRPALAIQPVFLPGSRENGERPGVGVGPNHWQHGRLQRCWAGLEIQQDALADPPYR